LPASDSRTTRREFLRDRAPEPGSMRNSGLFRRFRALVPGRAHPPDEPQVAGPFRTPGHSKTTTNHLLRRFLCVVPPQTMVLIQSDSASDAAVPAFWEQPLLIWNFKQPHLCTVGSVSCVSSMNAIFAGSSVEPQSISRFTRAAHNPSPELARHRRGPRRAIVGFRCWTVKRFLHAIPRPNSVTQDLVHRIDLDGRTGSLPNGTILPIRSRPATPPAFPHARCRMATFGWCLRQGVWENDPICYLFLGQHVVSGRPANKPRRSRPGQAH
jgi:hypothetical protein